MVRDTPLHAPAPETVATAVESVLDWSSSDVTAFDEGLNAVYRVDRADEGAAVVKTATFATDEELLIEAAVLRLIGAETDVPVPSVLATLGPENGPFEIAAFVMSYCGGREVTDVLELSPDAHERLVAESGRHLAAIHDARIVGGFGPLAISDGHLVRDPPHETWSTLFDELAADVVQRLRGEGFTTDDENRFVDLVPTVRDVLDRSPIRRDDSVAPALMLGDYRPANLVLAPDDSADPLIQGAIDLGCGPMADGLLDFALAEDALIDVPLGGTERAERLRDRFRTAYFETRGRDRGLLDADWYTRYRAYARARRMASFGYWAQFAREPDADTVAQRWRNFLRDRASELD